MRNRNPAAVGKADRKRLKRSRLVRFAKLLNRHRKTPTSLPDRKITRPGESCKFSEEKRDGKGGAKVYDLLR